jgi:iron complex outermembrane recepter protein
MFSGQPGFSGSTEVGEAYIETVVPLAQDAFLAKSLDIDAAARLAHYNHSGTQSAWKVGLNFAPWSAFRIRAVASQDIRAPNIGELDTPSFRSSIVTLPNPLPHGLPIFNSLGFAPGQNVNVQEIDGGNSNLRPEVAHTVSFGVVVQPPALPGFRGSLDHYRIRIGNAITALSVPTVIQNCAVGDSAACALISFPSGATLPVVQIMQVNTESFVTSGLDAEVAWHGALLGGNVSLRALANYIQQYKLLVAGAREQDLRGDLSSGLPELQGDISTQYTRGPTTVLIYETYIGSGDYNKALDATIQNNHVPHVWYLGATVQQGMPFLGRDCFAYASVNNLLNQKPPHPGFGIYTSLNNNIFTGVPYDRIGTFFRLGFIARL